MLAAIVVLAAVFFSTLVDAVGYSIITRKLHSLLTRQTTSEQRRLKAAIVQSRQELNQVSAMDEFAKWARLRRSLDKLTADYDKQTQTLAFEQAAFEVKAQALFRGLMLLGGVVLLWYFYATPMFFLPERWTGPLHALLSFPFAPKGSVGLNAWLLLCRQACQGILGRR